MDEKTIARFWTKVDKNGPIPEHVPHLGPCWVWIGTAQSRWYGHFSINGFRWYSHRLSYTIHNGDIPDGLIVCHKCDNPSCVRPEHMFLGTHADNSRDRSEKGRGDWGPNHLFRLHPERMCSSERRREICRAFNLVQNLGPARKGSANAQSKLTESDIPEIKRLRQSGVGPQKIADMYHVSRSLIQQTLRGDTWKHVPR